MENTKNLFEQAEQITALTETSGTGITTSFVEVPVETKDERTGEKVIVMRKVRNELAVNALVSIEQLLFIAGKSTKGLVLGMAKLTKAHAESIGLKSVKALLRNKFGKELDVNTIEKYRRIGLLFAADRRDPNNYEWREGIDPDVTVSNLDVVMTLFDLKGKKINLEMCSDSELDALYDNFYGQYIVLDKIHLLATQKTLKEEVKEILNPSIDGYAIEKDVDETSEGEGECEGECEGEGEGEGECKTDNAQESALNAIMILQTLFKDNKEAQKALKKIADMVDTLK